MNMKGGPLPPPIAKARGVYSENAMTASTFVAAAGVLCILGAIILTDRHDGPTAV